MSKGLVNYPVFVLTLVSILAIGYLSLYLLERIHSSITMNNAREKQVVEAEYILRNNSVFIKLSNNNVDYLYQITLFSNNTLKIYKLHKQRGLYGPLVLTNNTVEVLVINPITRSIVDYLLLRSIDEEIDVSIDEKQPPSITLYLDKPGFNYLESINGSSVFYRLKPVSYTRNILLDRNKIYRVVGDSIVYNETTIPNILLNTSIVEPSTVDQRLYELVNKYGYIVERREYLLNLYSYINTYLDSRTIYYSRLVTSNQMYFSQVVDLSSVVYNKDVLINTSIFYRVNQVVIRDIYGYTYVADISLKIWLLINSSFRILLGSIRFNTNEYPVAVMYNYSYVNNGSYNLRLLVEYGVNITQSLLGPAYFTINYLVHGGFENKLFIKSYLYDKLTVDLGYYSVVYRPLLNNTIVDLDITCFLNNSGVFYVFNNYSTNRFSTNYNGSTSIYVIDWTKPSAILTTPLYVDIIGINNSRYYVVNTTAYENTYGVYMLGDNSYGVLLFNPAIHTGDNYVVFKHSYETTLLITEDRVHLTYGNNYSTYNSIRDIYGFIVVSKVQYRYPLICIDNKYGLFINIRIEYIDNSMEIAAFGGNSCVYVKNTIIAKLRVITRNSVVGKYLFSTRSSVLLVISSNEIYYSHYVRDVFILNNRFKLYLVNNSFYILI